MESYKNLHWSITYHEFNFSERTAYGINPFWPQGAFPDDTDHDLLIADKVVDKPNEKKEDSEEE